MTPSRFAVVLTHNRPELVVPCVAAIGPQVDVVIVVDNASDPPVTKGMFAQEGGTPYRVVVVHNPEQPVNLPRLWKQGLAYADAANADRGRYHVAFLTDDTAVPVGWFSAVKAEMLRFGAAMGSVDPHGREFPTRHFTAIDNNLMNRTCPWACILDGTAGIEPDESMYYWWCDTDMDWQARELGGVVLLGVPGLMVENIRPNDYLMNKPGLYDQAGRDTEVFIKKRGYRPW